MQTFKEIDARRHQAGLTRKAVYDRAGVNKETWRRLAQDRNTPNLGTLTRLRDALDGLIAERQAAE